VLRWRAPAWSGGVFLGGKGLEEMGDLLEVLYALAAVIGVTPQVHEEAERKREERGGFDGRL
jgi:predicted house-cleaning noncanonical NTP pyrophosphatase (MazG superfamily)